MSLLPHSISTEISGRLGRAVARTGLTPNALTLIGLFGMAGASTLAAYGMFWQAGIVMLAAALFDLLDGAVARATGRASDWGAVFDAVSDRLADFAILFGLLIWYSAAERFDRTAIVLIAVSLFGSMMVSYTRSKAGEFGVSIRSGLGDQARACPHPGDSVCSHAQILPDALAARRTHQPDSIPTMVHHLASHASPRIRVRRSSIEDEDEPEDEPARQSVRLEQCVD